MADRTVFVDGTTSGTPGTNGAHYATLDAAFDGEVGAAPDLVSGAAILNIECSGTSADTAACLVSGFTTDATHYVNVYVAAGSRHDGKWNTGKHRLSVSTADALDVRINHIRFDGIQIELATNTGVSVINVQGQTGADIRFSNSIIRTHSNAASTAVVLNGNDTDVTYRFKNCVLQDRTNNSGSRVLNYDCTTMYAYNCTVATLNGTGIRGFSGASNIKNCAVIAGSGTGFVNSGTTFVNTNCISTDGTADDFSGSGNIANITQASMAFTDAANTDFHIGSGSSLRDQGIDLSADANYPVTTDIDGEVRTGTFDVGADSYEAEPALLRNHFSRRRR